MGSQKRVFGANIFAFYSAGQPKTPVDSSELSPEFSESFHKLFFVRRSPINSVVLGAAYQFALEGQS